MGAPIYSAAVARRWQMGAEPRFPYSTVAGAAALPDGTLVP